MPGQPAPEAVKHMGVQHYLPAGELSRGSWPLRFRVRTKAPSQLDNKAQFLVKHLSLKPRNGISKLYIISF